MEFSTVDLSWLPTDPDEQLALGFRVVSNSYKTRVSSLESEVRSLKSSLAEKTDNVLSLQTKNSNLEDLLVQANQRSAQLAEENKNLLNTVKNLRRDLDRLENLKRFVLSSFQEDSKEPETTNRYLAVDEVVNSVAPRTLRDLNGKDSSDPYFQTLAFNSTNRSVHDNPPTVAHRETVNGRQFFKNAKNLLHPDDFSEFLTTIKKFNAQLISRDQTLAHARQVFGEHSKAFDDFKQLLNPKN